MKKSTLIRVGALAALLLVALCVLMFAGGAALTFVSCSCRTSERDTRAAFSLDGIQPFRLEFGRGSGWHGLDTVKLDSEGDAILHRRTREQSGNGYKEVWETTRLKLSSAHVTELVQTVNRMTLLGMHKAYHDRNIADGTQWVFWVRQGTGQKSIYFNNHFPSKIAEFAQYLDKLLEDCGLANAKWQLVPDAEARQHERDIWDSIR